MKTTRDFDEQGLRKRPYLDLRLVGEVLAHPARVGKQGDGRLSVWGKVTDTRDRRRRVPREITLDDGEESGR